MGSVKLAKRLHLLKAGQDASSSSESTTCEVLEMRIDFKAARLADRTHRSNMLQQVGKGKQDCDSVTERQRSGNEALPWLQWRVKGFNECSTIGSKCSERSTEWITDQNSMQLRNAIARFFAKHHGYIFRGIEQNGAETSAAGGAVNFHFPLPGDVDLISGGPPCQGFSGLNIHRITDERLKLDDPENQLVEVFRDACLYYNVRYAVMEQVMACLESSSVIKMLKEGFKEGGYKLSFLKMQTGDFGVPQTRLRFLLFAAKAGVPMPDEPLAVTNSFVDHQEQLESYFCHRDAPKLQYGLPMFPHRMGAGAEDFVQHGGACPPGTPSAQVIVDMPRATPSCPRSSCGGRG